MPWGAAIAAVGAIGGAAISSSASKSAANTQADAAKDAASASNYQYNQTRTDQAPWRSAGANALAKLQYGLGIGPTSGSGVAKTQDTFDSQAYLAANPDVAANLGQPGGITSAWQHYQDFGQNEGRAFQFNADAKQQMADQQAAAGTSGTAGTGSSGSSGYGDLLRNFSMADYQADPGYAFRKSQGEKAINAQAAAKGRYNSGATLKSLDDFNSGLASQEYGNAFNRFQTQQQNQYNRLAGVAGTGQQATNFTDSAGAAATANSNNYLTSGAAASAAGTVGAANALTGGISQGLNYWQGQQYINALGNKSSSNPYAYNPNTSTPNAGSYYE
jgi:hypothetical protein